MKQGHNIPNTQIPISVPHTTLEPNNGLFDMGFYIEIGWNIYVEGFFMNQGLSIVVKKIPILLSCNNPLANTYVLIKTITHLGFCDLNFSN
jgi:hypothetical protein